MFGKLMSISDELMWKYYELLTDLSVKEIEALKARGEPMEAKMDLARRIIEDFHSKVAADEARRHFDSVIRKVLLSQLLLDGKLAPSRNEARRLIEQGAVSVDGGRAAEDHELSISRSLVLKVGKRRFLRVVRKGL
jgi:tyrosyl-tRNA synthetase